MGFRGITRTEDIIFQLNCFTDTFPNVGVTIGAPPPLQCDGVETETAICVDDDANARKGGRRLAGCGRARAVRHVPFILLSSVRDIY